MKKQDLVFTIIAVCLILVASIFALTDRITFNEWLASFGAIIAGVTLIKQSLVIKSKNERIDALEKSNKALTEEYYNMLDQHEGNQN